MGGVTIMAAGVSISELDSVLDLNRSILFFLHFLMAALRFLLSTKSSSVSISLPSS